MTICLGVICDGGKKVVVAADRMLTGGDVEFEQDVHKIDVATDNCVILSAGSALHHIELRRRVQNGFQSIRSPSVLNVINRLKNEFVEARRQRAEELYLRPLGLDYEQFIRLQGQLSESLLLRLTANIEEEQLNLHLLVAGVDDSGGHLYYIYDPGVSDCYDSVGFCAIGSGERHAELTFIRSGYSSQFSLNRAVFLAYQAKRDSEVAPGVGDKFTDMAIVDDDGSHFVHKDVLYKLNEVYEDLKHYHSLGHGEIQAKVDALEIKWVD